MAILYAVLLLFIVMLIWRINHPGDLRLTRSFIGQYVKDLQGRGPQRIQMSRLPVTQAPDQPEERVYYNIQAQFADGSKKSLLAQIVYPLEALQRDRERKGRPGADESMMEPMAAPMAMQRGDYTERLKEDPFKDLVKEEKVVEAVTKLVKSEVEGLRRLNRIPVIFPRLIAHDAKRLITLTEGVGVNRLDDQLQQRDGSERRELLQAVIRDLAVFHDQGKQLLGSFPPGAGHTEKQIRDALQDSLASWAIVGAPVTEEQFLEILDAARPLLETTQAEIGLRLVDSSPRAFYLQGRQAGRIAWGGVREDISAFDVIELVCDPAAGLAAADELWLLNYYLEQRQLEEGEKAELARDIPRLAIYYRLVLLGYLAQYRSARMDRQPGALKYWGPDAIVGAARNLQAWLAEDGELVGLLEQLRPALTTMQALR